MIRAISGSFKREKYLIAYQNGQFRNGKKMFNRNSRREKCCEVLIQNGWQLTRKGRGGERKSRKIGSVIALIDQPDNSITICVIQMVFNFPQRYLYFPIYISFVRNCLVSPFLPLRHLFLPPLWNSFFSFLRGHLKTAASRICISLTFLRSVPWNSIVRTWNYIIDISRFG